MTNAFNGFSMVLGSFNHWFQWFLMVIDHWTTDAMVSMDCSPLAARAALYLPLVHITSSIEHTTSTSKYNLKIHHITKKHPHITSMFN